MIFCIRSTYWSDIQPLLLSEDFMWTCVRVQTHTKWMPRDLKVIRHNVIIEWSYPYVDRGFPTLYLIVRLYMSKEQLTFVHPKSGEARESTYHRFSTALCHFHHYPNHCISHGTLQSTRRENIFRVKFSERVFFSLQNMTVIETEKDELFQQYLILYTERS